MNTHASRQVHSDAMAAFWLNSLKTAHSNLLKAIDGLAQLTRGPLPEKDVLIEVRWAVSQASLVRRVLWGRIHAYLSQHAIEGVVGDLAHLQEVDRRLIRSSAEHVGRWSADAVMRDWPGYCGASELMRGKMIEAIQQERRLLFPILGAIGT
jgi:hypothetical protein